MIEQTLSLGEMLSRLSAHADGLEQFSMGYLEELKRGLLSKVDNWRYYLDGLDDAAKRHRKYAAEHAEAARVSLAKRERAEQHLAYLMQELGYEKLPGKEWSVGLKKTTSLVIEGDKEPTEEVLDLFPSLVSMKLTWKKEAIKSAIRAERCPFNFVSLRDKWTPLFTPNKEI